VLLLFLLPVSYLQSSDRSRRLNFFASPFNHIIASFLQLYALLITFAIPLDTSLQSALPSPAELLQFSYQTGTFIAQPCLSSFAFPNQYLSRNYLPQARKLYHIELHTTLITTTQL